MRQLVLGLGRCTPTYIRGGSRDRRSFGRVPLMRRAIALALIALRVCRSIERAEALPALVSGHHRAANESPPRNAVEFAKPRRSRSGGKPTCSPLMARAVSRSVAASAEMACGKASAKLGELMPLDDPRSRNRHRIVRLDRSQRVEHPRRLHQGSRPAAASSTSRKTICMSSITARRSAPGCRSAKLMPRLHSLPERPDWIPYRTSYYAESWGFCLSHGNSQSLADGDVRGGHRLHARARRHHLWRMRAARAERGRIPHLGACLPSVTRNDNLSGIAIAAALARILAPIPRRYTYRFLFVPGTIGPIAWLFRNQARRTPG